MKPLISLALLLCTTLATAQDTTIHSLQLYITQHTPVLNQTVLQDATVVKVYQVDLPRAVLDRWQQELDLNHGEADATEKVMKFTQSAYGKQQLESYKALMMDVVAAFSQRIEKFPAAVINDQFVIYGVTDVQLILKIYQEWRQQNG